ncbi:uncharacterized protein LOC113561490 [Ooceraea biroi]|uniref:uncharacterized protein LOC113561490 n=1 Tax=Ooceraea biroi TaxID=2015173 RepID=UPI000F076843|nr:uncharacterized protein LOC113561490 [Ooceraea biroi]
MEMFSCKENFRKSLHRKLGSEEKQTKISETCAMLSQIGLKDEDKHIAYPRRSLFTMHLLAMTEYNQIWNMNKLNLLRKMSPQPEFEPGASLIPCGRLCQFDWGMCSGDNHRSEWYTPYFDPRFFRKDCEEKNSKLRDVLVDPTVICQMDYHTTMKSDYQSPYPAKPKPSLSSLPPLPEPWFLNRRTIGYSLQDLEKRCGYYMFLDDDMDFHQRIADLKIKRDKLSEILVNNKQ